MYTAGGDYEVTKPAIGGPLDGEVLAVAKTPDVLADLGNKRYAHYRLEDEQFVFVSIYGEDDLEKIE